MPLSLLGAGRTGTIIRIKGKDEQRRYIESLGFVEGAEVTVISELGGNLIVSIKESRIALDRSLANRIIVQ